MARRLSAPKIALITFGSIVVVFAVLVFAVSYFVLGIGRSNKAQDEIAPLRQGLAAMGGHEICDEGYDGDSPFADTTGAWYYVYYRVPDAAAARRFVFKKAAAMGEPLLPEPKNHIKYPGDDSYNSEPKDDGGLGVDIYCDTTTSGFCDSGDSQKVSVSGNAAVVGFTSFANN